MKHCQVTISPGVSPLPYTSRPAVIKNSPSERIRNHFLACSVSVCLLACRDLDEHILEACSMLKRIKTDCQGFSFGFSSEGKTISKVDRLRMVGRQRYCRRRSYFYQQAPYFPFLRGIEVLHQATSNLDRKRGPSRAMFIKTK